MTQEKDSKDKFSGLRKRAEESVDRKVSDMEDITALSPEEVQRLVHELRVHQIELEVQNEDLRQAQVKLEELKDRYVDLYDFAPVGYLTLNQKGLILEANLTAVRLLGEDRQTLIKRPFSGFVCQPYGDAYYLHLQQVFETKSKQTCEIELKRKEGSHFFAQMECIALEDENGQSNRCRGIIVDITERKKREEALRDSWSELHAIYEYAPIMMCVLDTHRQILYANRAFVQFVGKNESELKEGRACGVFGCINSFDDPRGCGYGPHCEHCSLRLAIEDTYKTGIGHREIEYRSTLIGKDCSREIVFRGSTALIQTIGQSNVLLCLEDVTDLQGTLEALRVSEERFRLALDATHDALWDWDMETGAVFRSKGFYEMLGCESGVFEGGVGDWHHLVLPEDYAAVQRRLGEYLEGKRERHEIEFRVRKPSGDVIWIHSRGQVVAHDETGKPLRMVGTHTDVTERKNAEESLRRNQSMLARTENIAHVGSWEWDVEPDKVTWSEELFRIFKRNPADGAPSFSEHAELYPLEDVERLRALVTEALRSGRPYEIELQAIRKDGETRHCLARGQAEMGPEGRATRLYGSFQDITERKQAEHQLWETNRRLQDSQRIAKIGTWEWNPATDETYWSEEAYRLFGLEPGSEKPSYELAKRLAHPEDAEAWERAVAKALDTEDRFVYDYRAIRTDGEVIWIHNEAEVVRDGQGNVTRLVGTAQDITERKVTEETLKKSESLLTNIVEQSPYAMWIGDSEGTLIRMNKVCRESLKIADEEVIGKYNILEDSIVKEKGLLDVVRSVFHSGNVARFEIEYDTSQLAQVRLREKVALMLDVTVSPVFDRSGKIMNIVVQHIDITERKRMEETLRASEERFRTLLEVSPTGFWATDPIGKNTYVSPYWTKMTGIFKEDAQEDGWSSGLHPDDKDAIFAGWAQAALNGEPYTSEFRFIQPDGQCVWVLCQALAVKTDEGNIVEWLGTITDITERKRSEEKLQKSEERYRTVVDNLSIGISVINRSMEVEAINPFFAAYYPHARAGRGAICYEMYNDPPRSSPCSYCPCVLTFQDGKVHESETDTPAGGQIRHYRIVSCPVKNDHDEVELVIELVEDVTERRSLYAQLAQAQKMEAVGTLAGGIAHDFNNILQVVLGYSELVLADEDLPDRLKNDLGKVVLSARNGADLVQRLLTFSRKAETRPLDLDLNQRIRQTQKFLERTLPKMIDIELILTDDLDRIHADAIQVDQVLMNLAVNARDAMPDGGRLVIQTANVFLDEASDKALLGAKPGQCVLLSVSDTGHGMDKETLGHIFEPFYTTKEAGKGTGLGLAMVYGIVHQHDGYIICYSEPGEGTTFKIYFPSVEMKMNPDVAATGMIPAFGTETILLVDDEEFIRDLGTRILERSGYTVLTAANGKDALELYKREIAKISLVILDVIMPEMGGKQCLEELLRIDPKARVLIASGYSEEGHPMGVLQGGAKGFVSKPFDMRQLLQTVRKVLDET